jgi:uncharacterized protein YicC (UPF0701 family)
VEVAERQDRWSPEGSERRNGQMATRTEEGETGVTEYLEQAVEDLNEARHRAGDEVRASIDSAISRAREALDDLRVDAKERADRLRTRAEDRTSEWQQTLEGATEDARRELGLRAVRAQRTKDALDALADEIKRHKKEIAD